MARTPRERYVRALPLATVFKPAGVPARHLERVVLALDELEALRLVDLEGWSHEQAAESMGVSRQTVGRIVEAGRRKVADALLNGKAVEIEGGPYRLTGRRGECRACGSRWPLAEGVPDRPPACPACRSADILVCPDDGPPCERPGRGRRGEGRGRLHGRGDTGRGHGAGHGGGRGGAT